MPKTTSGRCLSCKRWQTWPGGHADRPACECGAVPDREAGRLIDEQLAEIDTLAAVERRQRESARR